MCLRFKRNAKRSRYQNENKRFYLKGSEKWSELVTNVLSCYFDGMDCFVCVTSGVDTLSSSNIQTSIIFFNVQILFQPTVHRSVAHKQSETTEARTQTGCFLVWIDWISAKQIESYSRCVDVSADWSLYSKHNMFLEKKTLTWRADDLVWGIYSRLNCMKSVSVTTDDASQIIPWSVCHV